MISALSASRALNSFNPSPGSGSCQILPPPLQLKPFIYLNKARPTTLQTVFNVHETRELPASAHMVQRVFLHVL